MSADADRDAPRAAGPAERAEAPGHARVAARAVAVEVQPIVEHRVPVATDHDLAALIKTLTVLEERLPEFRAGSVSPVIWLFRRLSDRSPADLTPLVDWVLAHTQNPYLPFGTSNFGARSSAELVTRSALSAERAARRRADEANRQLQAERCRATAATRKLFGALRRRDERAIAALLAQGADVRVENEHGQTALEFARSVGLRHLLAPGLNDDDEHGAPPATSPAP